MRHLIDLQSRAIKLGADDTVAHDWVVPVEVHAQIVLLIKIAETSFRAFRVNNGQDQPSYLQSSHCSS